MMFFKEDPYEITEYTGYDLHDLFINNEHISEKGILFYIEIPLEDGSYGFEIYDYEKNKVLYTHTSIISPTLEDDFGLNFFEDYHKMLPPKKVTLYFNSFEFTPLSKKISCYKTSREQLDYAIFNKKLDLLGEYKNKILSSEQTFNEKLELFKIIFEKYSLLNFYEHIIKLDSQNDFMDEVDFIQNYISEDTILKNMTIGFFQDIANKKETLLPMHEKLLQFLVQNPEASNNTAIKETPISQSEFYKYHNYALKKFKKESE